MGIDSQVCFHRGLFSSLSNHEGAQQGHVDCDCLCHLLDTHYRCLCLNGSTFGFPPTHPFIRAICDVTVAVKKLAQNPAVLAS